jgi:DNA mismatch endonuclease (patch repair protein)
MADVFSIKKRREIMSSIRSKNTTFELDFFKKLSITLWPLGYRYRKHYAGLRGKPDVIFIGQRVAVFLDSDFWHGWRYPRWRKSLKNDFWRNKIERNRKRDLLTTRYLKSKGWRVLRIWEHQLNESPTICIGRIEQALKSK